MNEQTVLNPDKSADNSQEWARKWTSTAYVEKRRHAFEQVDNYLGIRPNSILDIGCGFAHQSRFFNEKYGSNLWLLDGDSSSNNATSYGNWNDNADDLKFYHPVNFLESELQRLGTKNFTFVDAKNINIPTDLKFDLITSWLSCGYHYPVNTYRDLILKHSHEHTRIVIDIRTKGTPENYKGVEGFEIVNVISVYGKKRSTVEIKLI